MTLIPWNPFWRLSPKTCRTQVAGSDVDGGAGTVGAPVDVDAGYEDGIDEGSEEPVDLVSPDSEEGFG